MNFMILNQTSFLKTKEKKFQHILTQLVKKLKKIFRSTAQKAQFFGLGSQKKKKETIFIYNSKNKKINFKINRRDDFINEHKNLYINENKKIIKNLNLKNSIETMVCINKLLNNV